MGPNRTKDRLSGASRRRQRGMTAIGFMLLACVFGLVGFAGLKAAPLYMQKMRLNTVLNDIEQEMQGRGNSVQSIRNELESRFYIEGLQIPRENVSIRQVRDGYQIQVKQENRTPFIADLWFLVVLDEQVEIHR